jgi:hypothetical protein
MWLICSLHRNEYRNLKLTEPTWEGNWGGVKRTKRNELILVAINICMKTTQGNSLCSYLYFKLANT